jgi:murein DD-endopeptidase MepM/ murein hydrolase activator NlpD
MAPIDPRVARYIQNRLDAGALTLDDIALLTEAYQAHVGILVDGMPGPETLARLRGLPPAPAMRKVWPLPLLADLRKPQITSGFGPRGGKPHNGADMFYRWQAGDGPVKVGDGGAARDWSLPDAPPKWFIPPGTNAIAAAGGRVQLASSSPTGHRVWIEHPDGTRTGYFHLAALHVRIGQVVGAGHRLGPVGDNPSDVDATHLHFEVSPIDTYDPRDPAEWLEGATYLAI